MYFSERRNSEGVASSVRIATRQSQLLQSCEEINLNSIPQGFKANPGLKLANAFSVNFMITAHHFLLEEGPGDAKLSSVFPDVYVNHS